MNTYKQAVSALSPRITRLLYPPLSPLLLSAQEFRLRTNRPLVIRLPDKQLYINKQGKPLLSFKSDDVFIVNQADIADSFNRMCGYSVYAKQEQINNGFITVSGGHRAGICGTAVSDVNGIRNIKSISSINLRLAREHKGCASELYKIVRDTTGGLLICGAPCSGKTTVLRDLGRLVSTIGEKSTALIDERGELAATVGGVCQNDVGFCDVFDGYKKSAAMEHAVRAMSPELIFCDEIGSADDVKAIEACLNSGVRFVCTIHAATPNELRAKPAFLSLKNTGAFETAVFLYENANVGKIKSVTKLRDLNYD